MPRVCTICCHEARAEIDAALVEAAPKRRIAARFGVAESSLRRHAEGHLSALLAQASEAEVVRADDLLGDARRLQDETFAVLEAAKAAGNLIGVLAAVDRAQRGIALLGGMLERLAGAPDALVISWADDPPCPKCGWNGDRLQSERAKPAAEVAQLPSNVHPIRPISGVERGPA